MAEYPPVASRSPLRDPHGAGRPLPLVMDTKAKVALGGDSRGGKNPDRLGR